MVVNGSVAGRERLDRRLVDVAIALRRVGLFAARLALGGGDLAGLDQLLQSVQVFLNLLARLLAPQLRDERRQVIPAGGLYWSSTLTSVPRPAGASLNQTDPACWTGDPSRVRQAIISPSIWL